MIHVDALLNKPLFKYLLKGETIAKSGGLTLFPERPFTS